MQTKEAIISLCNHIEAKLIELTSEREFRHNIKDSAKKDLYGALNVAFELKHSLTMGYTTEKDKEVEDCIEVLNKLYYKLFGKTDKIRRTIFKPIKEVQEYNNRTTKSFNKR